MLLFLLFTQILTLAGLAYCFALIRRGTARGSEAELERLVTVGVEDLLQELQESADKAIRDLARQKATLQKLLREADKRIQLIPDEEEQPVARARRKGKLPPARPQGWQEEAVQLAREGMSPHAIARQLRAGVEEVRIVLARALPPSA